MKRNIETIEHSRGLLVLLEPLDFLETVSFHCWIKAGSLHEKQGTYASAHFLEHILFTASFDKSNAQLAHELAQTGGYANAFTTFDHTGYECIVPEKWCSKGLKWIQNIVLEPVFDPLEIEREKNVILSEFADTKDEPSVVFEEAFWDQVYQGQTLGRTIIGSKEDIESVSRHSLAEFYQRHYHAQNMVLSICGNFDRDTIHKELDAYIFSNIESTQASLTLQQKPSFAPVDFLFQKQYRQRKIEVLFEGVDIMHEDVAGLELLSACLGGGDYSYFYQELRQKENIVSYIDCQIFISSIGGHLEINAIPYPGKAEQVREKLQKIFDGDFAFLTDELIDFAKKDLEKEVFYALDTTWGRSKLNTYFATLFENVWQQKTYYEKLQRINKSDLIELAHRYLNKKPAWGVWKAKDDV